MRRVASRGKAGVRLSSRSSRRRRQGDDIIAGVGAAKHRVDVARTAAVVAREHARLRDPIGRLEPGPAVGVAPAEEEVEPQVVPLVRRRGRKRRDRERALGRRVAHPQVPVVLDAPRQRPLPPARGAGLPAHPEEKGVEPRDAPAEVAAEAEGGDLPARAPVLIAVVHLEVVLPRVAGVAPRPSEQTAVRGRDHAVEGRAGSGDRVLPLLHERRGAGVGHGRRAAAGEHDGAERDGGEERARSGTPSGPQLRGWPRSAPPRSGPSLRSPRLRPGAPGRHRFARSSR